MSEEFTETYRWRLEDEAGQPLASEHSVPFPTQADAESWVGEIWASLAEIGILGLPFAEDAGGTGAYLCRWGEPGSPRRWTVCRS